VRGVKRGEILCSYENIAEFQVSADSVMYGSVPVQLRANWHTAKPGEVNLPKFAS